jgi:hypothetical protein
MLKISSREPTDVTPSIAPLSLRCEPKAASSRRRLPLPPPFG